MAGNSKWHTELKRLDAAILTQTKKNYMYIILKIAYRASRNVEQKGTRSREGKVGNVELEKVGQSERDVEEGAEVTGDMHKRRGAAKGGDLFIGMTHVGDDAANSRPEFAHYTMPPGFAPLTSMIPFAKR
ncbi:hypothetical protein WN55_10433 [Dufourea novaeangliae]|uniref:Uncharacterized protein n=1 Tax=Dufourea novaeangliae TaxID=178035 RepID=A0A154P3X1_DUFNO|nr:hypothetical protein WN55_10433 [Dufourea novaeangliae]